LKFGILPKKAVKTASGPALFLFGICCHGNTLNTIA